MGACATKPIELTRKKDPVEINEETYTPRSAPEVPPTTTESATAEEVEKLIDAVEERNDEDKLVDASDSNPTSPPEEQKFDDIEKPADSKLSDAVEEKKDDEEKLVDASDVNPTSPPEEQKFEKAPEETPSKENEAIEQKVAGADSTESKS